MKVAEWIHMNRDIIVFNDVIVSVFRRKSRKIEDKAMETEIKFLDMEKIFGEYTIIFINLKTYKIKSDLLCDGDDLIERTTLCFGIYLDEENNEEV